MPVLLAFIGGKLFLCFDVANTETTMVGGLF